MDAFLDAAAAGDLTTVEDYLACPDVLDNVAVWNAEHRARRLRNGFTNRRLPDPWFYSRDRDEDVFKSCIIPNGHVELLQWFFMPERLAIMEHTLWSDLTELMKAIVQCRPIPTGFAMFEVFAGSSLFNRILDDNERSEILVEMTSVAASKGLSEWVGFLLSHGAGPNAPTGSCQPPIVAAGEHGDAETIDILLSHGTTLDHKYQFIYRGYGRWEGIIPMIERGADINRLLSCYGSPLHHATVNCLEDIMELLFRHFADVDIRDLSGRTPLMAVQKRKDPIRRILWDHLKIAKLLLDHGADIDAVDTNACGVLHTAIEMWDFELAQFLLDHGANPNCQDVDGCTPLINVLKRTRGGARKQVAEFIHRMLEAGADPNLCDNEGISPAQQLAGNKTGRAFMTERPQFFCSK